jgi:DNA-binding LacI/PurR family transcriptional regulator
MSKKPVQNIEDIARLAKVSKSTVSRALNDSPLVKTETKELVRSIAREHNFRLNAPARRLSLKQSCTVAFVTHAYYHDFSVDDLFTLEIMGGISYGLHELGYDMLVIHVDLRDSDWAHQYLDSGRVDGFILLTAGRKQSHIRNLVKMEAPFIAWGVASPGQNFCTVNGDNFSGGKLATEHLIGAGRQRIGFLGGPASETEVQIRYQGYEHALRAAGRPVDPDLVVYGEYCSSGGADSMQRLFEQAPDVDGVFASSDLTAIAAIEVIRSRGCRVPEDIAVVGYDDLSIASYNYPPLTTIRQNVPLAGRLLAQNLIQHLKTGVVTQVTMPVELIVRKSA